MRRRPEVKVVTRRLGAERAWATQEENVLTIDPRVRSHRRLELLIHEYLHYLFPDWSETKVDKVSKRIACVVWYDRWRRIDR